MGYTHYWNHTGFTDEQWAEVMIRAKTILDAANSIGIPVQWEDDVNKPPEVSTKCIRFNGVGDDGHETFLVSRIGQEFEFCKTARKPYDTVVVALLIMLHDVNSQFTWSSDGDTKDHKFGKQLYDDLKDTHLTK